MIISYIKSFIKHGFFLFSILFISKVIGYSTNVYILKKFDENIYAYFFYIISITSIFTNIARGYLHQINTLKIKNNIDFANNVFNSFEELILKKAIIFFTFFLILSYLFSVKVPFLLIILLVLILILYFNLFSISLPLSPYFSQIIELAQRILFIFIIFLIYKTDLYILYNPIISSYFLSFVAAIFFLYLLKNRIIAHDKRIKLNKIINQHHIFSLNKTLILQILMSVFFFLEVFFLYNYKYDIYTDYVFLDTITSGICYFLTVYFVRYSVSFLDKNKIINNFKNFRIIFFTIFLYLFLSLAIYFVVIFITEHFFESIDILNYDLLMRLLILSSTCKIFISMFFNFVLMVNFKLQKNLIYMFVFLLIIKSLTFIILNQFTNFDLVVFLFAIVIIHFISLLNITIIYAKENRKQLSR